MNPGRLNRFEFWLFGVTVLQAVQVTLVLFPELDWLVKLVFVFGGLAGAGAAAILSLTGQFD